MVHSMGEAPNSSSLSLSLLPLAFLLPTPSSVNVFVYHLHQCSTCASLIPVPVPLLSLQFTPWPSIQPLVHPSRVPSLGEGCASNVGYWSKGGIKGVTMSMCGAHNQLLSITPFAPAPNVPLYATPLHLPPHQSLPPTYLSVFASPTPFSLNSHPSSVPLPVASLPSFQTVSPHSPLPAYCLTPAPYAFPPALPLCCPTGDGSSPGACHGCMDPALHLCIPAPG